MVERQKQSLQSKIDSQTRVQKLMVEDIEKMRKSIGKVEASIARKEDKDAIEKSIDNLNYDNVRLFIIFKVISSGLSQPDKELIVKELVEINKSMDEIAKKLEDYTTKEVDLNKPVINNLKIAFEQSTNAFDFDSKSANGGNTRRNLLDFLREQRLEYDNAHERITSLIDRLREYKRAQTGETEPEGARLARERRRETEEAAALPKAEEVQKAAEEAPAVTTPAPQAEGEPKIIVPTPPAEEKPVVQPAPEGEVTKPTPQQPKPEAKPKMAESALARAVRGIRKLTGGEEVQPIEPVPPAIPVAKEEEFLTPRVIVRKANSGNHVDI